MIYTILWSWKNNSKNYDIRRLVSVVMWKQTIRGTANPRLRSVMIRKLVSLGYALMWWVWLSQVSIRFALLARSYTNGILYNNQEQNHSHHLYVLKGPDQSIIEYFS